MANIIVRGKRPLTVFEEMDRILDSVFDNVHSFGRVGSLGYRHPAVDISENDKEYQLVAEIPGFDESEVEVKVDEGILSINASKEGEKEEGKEDGRYLVRERRSAKFSRSFVVPKDVDQDKINAGFSKGLLTLTLPKVEKAQAKKITIKKA